MIIKVIQAKDPFTRVPNAVVNDAQLSFRALGVLVYFLSKPHDWVVRSDDLVFRGKEGRDALRSAMQELKTAGYAQLRAGTGFGRYWVVCADPETLIKQSLKSRLSEKPENPTPENPSLFKEGTDKESRRTPIIPNNHRAAEAIYNAYPIKVAKPRAIAAIEKQLKKFPAEMLLAKTQEFSASRNGDVQFCPHPATWFNQERFNDDPATWKPKSEQTKPQFRGNCI